MKSLSVSIIEFVDNSQPGWVRATFKDVDGKEWSIVDKPVYFDTYDLLVPDAIYPQQGRIDCHIIAEHLDQDNRRILTIDIGVPFGLETEDRETQFKVCSDQIEDGEST